MCPCWADRVARLLRGMVVVFALLVFPAPPARAEQEPALHVTEDATTVTITTANYSIPITKSGFRYGFQKLDGTPIVAAHPTAGIAWSQSNHEKLSNADSTRLVAAETDRVRLSVTNIEGGVADVVIIPGEHMVHMQIVPSSPVTPTVGVTETAPLTYTIDAQLSAPGKAYGLGDNGGSNALNITNNDFTDVPSANNGRFVSNFAVFPAQGFAQVLFWPGRKRVEVTKSVARLGVANAQQINDLYYFIGTMPDVYAAYKAAKVEAGYPDYKPKYAMFEVGWEAYGALGWNTNQANVTQKIQDYLDHGYHFGWAVVGSRTWRGDPAPITAGTTRFGMWDDGSPGSTNPPRYPDPAAFKRFFKEQNIKLLIGLRINMDPDNPFYEEASKNKYFIPGHPPLIDTHNPAALDWYIQGANLWGVDGFKEDLCCGQSIKYFDNKINPANERLMQQGSYVIVRNSAYSAPGDISRREDTEFNGYWGAAGELLRLGIAYGASAAPNYYPDIVGGTNLQRKEITEAVRRYFTRNATIAAAMPAMSFGFAPWDVGEEVATKVKRAADWHNRFAPYIYSAAAESFASGYPHTLTPLMIAYPDDAALYDLSPVEWMLGPSMLAVGACYEDYNSIGGDECTADVRLPAGVWIDPETGKQYEGPTTLKEYAFPLGKIPVFVGGKGVTVERDLANNQLLTKVYPVATNGSRYTFTAPDGTTTSTITNDNTDWDRTTLRLRDVTTNELVEFTVDETTGALSFPLAPGHSYRLYTEQRQYFPNAGGKPPEFPVYLPFVNT